MTHEKFKQRVKDSRPAEWAAARWLVDEQNHTVMIRPVTIAEKREDWAKHSDKGDLMVVVDGKWERFEVKHSSYDWESRETWPFHTGKLIVCSKGSFDRAEKKPYCYLIINNDMTHVAVVSVRKTIDDWVVEAMPDRGFPDEPDQEKYWVHVDKVKFYKLWPDAPQRKTPTRASS